MKLKIYNWIDKHNYIVCLKILKTYNQKNVPGDYPYYTLHLRLLGYYFIRFLLVLAAFLSVKKDSLKTFLNLLTNKRSAFYFPVVKSWFIIKIADVVAQLFGYRYFSDQNLIPFLRVDEILESHISINSSPEPAVSIIIRSHNELAYTFNCLKAIQNTATKDLSLEIIVIDDCSTDETYHFLCQNTAGIRSFRNDNYAGIYHSFNLGVRASKANIICFLDNTTQVQKGWLPKLLPLLKDEKTGCAGSMITYSNGLLKSAGGLIYDDHTAISYGKFEDALHPFYNYKREADYPSPHNLIMHKSDYQLLKLVSNEIESLSDFIIATSLKIKEWTNKKIIYQPLSKIIYTKLDSFEQEIMPTSGHINNYARKYQKGKSILFIDDVIPAPDQDSGSNRLFQILNITQSLGYHVIFMPNDGNKRGHYFDSMIEAGFEILYKYPNRKKMLALLPEILTHIDAIWLCKPHINQTFKSLFENNNRPLWIYDTVDLHYLRTQREAHVGNNFELLQAAEQTKQLELSIARCADVTIAITKNELSVLRQENIKNVTVIPNIHKIITPSELPLSFEERSGILFIGGYLHSPNIDAAKWLIQHIMPQVWKTFPKIKVTLLGSNPPGEISSLESPMVSVPGYIHDVSPYFNSCRIFVAPLRFGAGMKGKIGQSLEHNLPIVSTTIGIEGMDLTDNYNILVADDTDNFAAKIIELYHSEELWKTIQRNSLMALNEFSVEKAQQNIEYLFDSLAWTEKRNYQ